MTDAERGDAAESAGPAVTADARVANRSDVSSGSDAVSGSDASSRSDAATDAIAAIDERADAVRERELRKALARLEAADLSPAERAAVESLADRLVARLVAVPTRALRAEDADDETVENARDLFA